MDNITQINNSENSPPANNMEKVLNKNESGPETKQTNAPPSKSFMMICGIITGIIVYPLTLFLSSIGIPWIVFLGLIGLFLIIRNKHFFWGVALGLFIPPLLFFGSCILSPSASLFFY
jgi:hypothetical protein